MARTSKKQNQAYVMLRQKGEKSYRYLPLPFSLGKSSSNPLIIASQIVADRSKIVYAHKGEIYALDLQSDLSLPLKKQIENYGIEMRGPFYGDYQSALSRLVAKLRFEERRLFVSLQTALPKLPAQSLRPIVYGGLALLVILMMFARQEKAPIIDRSRTPIALEKNTLRPVGGGYMSPSFTGLKSGITYQFETASKQDLLFEFEGVELNIKNEIEIFLNEQSVYSFDPQRDCHTQDCKIMVPLPEKYIQEGVNEIFVRHHNEDSYYNIRNLMLSDLKAIEPGEKIVITDKYNLAKRWFDEREISYKNLILAKKELDKVLMFLNARKGTEDLMTKALALRTHIDEHFSETVESLWFDAKKYKQLGEVDKAIEVYNTLQSIYFDRSSPEYKAILDEIKALQEMKL